MSKISIKKIREEIKRQKEISDNAWKIRGMLEELIELRIENNSLKSIMED